MIPIIISQKCSSVDWIQWLRCLLSSINKCTWTGILIHHPADVRDQELVKNSEGRRETPEKRCFLSLRWHWASCSCLCVTSPDRLSWLRSITSSTQSEGNQPVRPLTVPSQYPPSPTLNTGGVARKSSVIGGGNATRTNTHTHTHTHTDTNEKWTHTKRRQRYTDRKEIMWTHTHTHTHMQTSDRKSTRLNSSHSH